MPIADAGRGIRHLFIRDLVLAVRVGVHRHERRVAQRVRLNVDLAVLEGSAGASDRLEDVVDYAALYERIRAEATGKHANLVETLAERLAALCLDEPRIRSARVRVEKLDVYAEAAAVGVEIERLSPHRAPLSASAGTATEDPDG